jgi:hypothetical protein
LALLLSISSVASTPAEARLMNTGFGPFYDGLTHLFVTPEDLLQVIAIALLAGLRGPRIGRAVLFALPAAWLVGTVAGLLVVPPVTLTAATAITIIALGALVATDRPTAADAGRGHRNPHRITQRRPQRNRAGESAVEWIGSCGYRMRDFRRCVDLRRASDFGARSVGAHRGARGGKLDRRQRPVHARLGDPG